MYKGTYGPKKSDVAAVAGGDKGDESSNGWLYGTLALILGLLSIVLAKIISNLRHLALVKEGAAVGPQPSLWEMLTSKGIVGFLLFALVLFGGYTTVNNAINVGRQQGYAPEQPINPLSLRPIPV